MCPTRCKEVGQIPDGQALLAGGREKIRERHEAVAALEVDDDDLTTANGMVPADRLPPGPEHRPLGARGEGLTERQPAARQVVPRRVPRRFVDVLGLAARVAPGERHEEQRTDPTTFAGGPDLVA